MENQSNLARVAKNCSADQELSFCDPYDVAISLMQTVQEYTRLKKLGGTEVIPQALKDAYDDMATADGKKVLAIIALLELD